MEPIDLVILAAGKGTRFLPLTSTTPKPLLKIAGKSILEHNLSILPEHIHKIIIVTGYMAEKMKEKLGDNFNGIPIEYVVQEQQKGTADALLAAKNKINTQNFLLIYGDDLYNRSFFESLNQVALGLIGVKTENWQNFGVLKTKDDGVLEKIIEKPVEFSGDLVNIGFYKLNTSIFELAENLNDSSRGELELTDLVSQFSMTNSLTVVVSETGWLPLSNVWDALTACEFLTNQLDPQHLAHVEEGAVIKGRVFTGKNTVIKSGAYIEGNFYIGENCVIGPNCYLKGFGSIGDNVHIGNGVEVSRSILFDNVNARHLSYIGDSILGNDVNFGAGTVTANLRFDNANIKTQINGQLVDSGKMKFGAVIGDGVKTGANSAIMPGVKIRPGAFIMPLEVVGEDK